MPFTPPELPHRAGSVATKNNLPALDDLRFAQLANYGAIPDNYPRPHPEQPLAWPKRMRWAVAVAVMVLALVLIAVA